MKDRRDGTRASRSSSSACGWR